jgi:hypothetical protein
MILGKFCWSNTRHIQFNRMYPFLKKRIVEISENKLEEEKDES